MPKVTRPKDHPQDVVELPDGTVVARGKSADVDDETAAALAEQGWTVAAKTTAKKAAGKTTASPDADTQETQP